MKSKPDMIHILTADRIIEICIDAQGRLCVTPTYQTFEYIYRAAAEVGWDTKGNFLFSPKPREWSYYDWYRHIIDIAKDEYGCQLLLTDKTKWTNVPNDLKQQIINPNP